MQARLLFVAGALALTACRTPAPLSPLAPLPTHPRPPDAARRAGQTKDPAVAAELLWLHANQRPEARARLERGLATAPYKAPWLLRLALLDLVELRLDAAVDALTRLIAHAPETPEAEAALLLLYEHLDDVRHRQADIEAAVVKADLLGPGPAATSGRVTLASALLARVARGQLDSELERTHLHRGGWLTEWRSIGPLAPMDRGAFLTDARYAQSGDWSMLPHFRGAPVQPQVVRAEGHRVRAAPSGAPGLYVYDAYFEVSEAAASQPLMLEAHLPGSARIALDGAPVLARDAALRRAARRAQVPLRLAAGWHRLAITLLSGSQDTFAVALTTREGQPVVAASKSGPLLGAPTTLPAAVGDDATRADGALGLVGQLAAPPEHSAFARLLGVVLTLGPWLDDPDLAWGLLDGTEAALPGSAALLLAQAWWLERADLGAAAQARLQDALRSDATLPAALVRLSRAAREEQPEWALSLAEAARTVAPGAWAPEAAAMEVHRRLGQNPEAAAALARAAAARAPARVLRSGVRLLRGLRRDADADALEQEILRLDPGAGPRLRAERAAEAGRLEAAVEAFTEAAALGGSADDLVRAAELYLAALRPAEAGRAARAALDKAPTHAGAWRVALQAALLTGDTAGAEDALAQLRARSDASLELEAMLVGGADPALPAPPRPMAGAAALLGRCPEPGAADAQATASMDALLCEALAFDPWPWVRPGQPGERPPGQDPADRWAAHQSVLLLDRLVERVLPDGRALSAFHAVTRLQTKEAADQAGELELPTDALALTLGTLKPDGRHLEMDRHAGKDDLSFSALAPGDAVERRWVRMESPATPWGGYLRKFYFASGSPMLRSELAVVVERGTPVVHLEVNGAPAPRVIEAGGQVLYLWQALEQPAVPPEPYAAAADEFVPYVVVAVGVTVAHALATTQLGTDASARGSRQVSAQALTLTGTIADPEARAERLLRFVVETVDDGPPRPPEQVLSTRRGERSGLFAALLSAAEIPAEVVWARPALAPPLLAAAPDPQAFAVKLVRLEPRPGVVRWAHLDGERWWYGALPPHLAGGLYLHRAGPKLEVSPLPAGDDAAWRLSTRAELTVSAAGDARGHLAVTLPAGYAPALRAFLRSARAEDKARQLQGLAAALVRGARLVGFTATPLDAPLAPLTLDLEVEVQAFMVPDGPHLVAEELFERPAGLRTVGLPLLEAYLVAPRRSTPLLVRPAEEELQVILHLPPGAEAEVAPGRFERNLPFGRFAQDFTLDAARGEARLSARYGLQLGRISPEGYGAFAQTAQEVLQAMRNRLVLRLP
jgi:tetratricopeptide (TPR) repeat protein